MGAKRYSGDVELRIEPRVWQDDIWYVFHVTAPGMRRRAVLSRREAKIGADDPRDPASYDSAARELLKRGLEYDPDLPVEVDGNRIVVRRVFQSPCPAKRDYRRKKRDVTHKNCERRR